MAAIAYARYQYPIRVQVGLCLDPVQQCANVFIGIFAKISIVELKKLLAVA